MISKEQLKNIDADSFMFETKIIGAIHQIEEMILDAFANGKESITTIIEEPYSATILHILDEHGYDVKQISGDIYEIGLK